VYCGTVFYFKGMYMECKKVCAANPPPPEREREREREDWVTRLLLLPVATAFFPFFRKCHVPAETLAQTFLSLSLTSIFRKIVSGFVSGKGKGTAAKGERSRDMYKPKVKL